MTEAAVFLYDGDCAFCSRCAGFIERHIATPARVAPWQWTDIDTLGLSVDDCDAAVQWVAPGGRRAAGPDAIAAMLRTAPGALGLWKTAGLLLRFPPVRAVAWPVYRWVARNRHRMPGGTAACSLPQAQRNAGNAA
ncbi:putative DCC family thiol-disulfide oxidoreductase YuxK [Stackebrandtia albiflava]|uniref:Putative DCC family thiol-disulfide oxidoreductase YuxK n=1 Tax=Stackebrandtia albiflava TaxID=406432 RepID=A0A562UPK7_9ACTN|nr:DUF393 domain-containing protein [Stackebrandtia albiflava]TWJ07526.1 putative DCC family thiol-disulfide oxidoreductase YuxK [Stackebrandtia albiflava]